MSPTTGNARGNLPEIRCDLATPIVIWMRPNWNLDPGNQITPPRLPRRSREMTYILTPKQLLSFPVPIHGKFKVVCRNVDAILIFSPNLLRLR